MKPFLLFFFNILCLNIVFAQYPFDGKRDYIWNMAYHNGLLGDTTFLMHFSTTDFEIEKIVRDSRLDPYLSNTSMCDTAGNLLFYSNGLHVGNRLGQLMENGDSLLIDPDGYETYDGLELPQAIISLPVPEHPMEYYIIQQDDRINEPSDPEYLNIYHLFYASLAMTENQGLGKVMEKKIILKDDTLNSTVSACRHANGRDWWLLQPERRTGKYYRFLLSPDGFTEYPPDSLSEIFAYGSGQAHFSPDGTKYVRFISWGGVTQSCMQVYDFDRCSGLLSNPRTISKVDYHYVAGGAISPNSKYAYMIEKEHIWQYDLTADDIAASEILVATYDGFYDEYPLFRTVFALAQLAPDGRIYIMTTNGTRYLHVITNPNLPGEACGIIQHGISLPTWNWSIPHYPCFRLGPLDGSPCDTLGIDNLVATQELPLTQDIEVRVYPNPVSDYFFVQFPEPVYDAELVLFDAAGKEVMLKPLSAVVSTVDVRNLPGGLFLYSIRDKEGAVIKSGKIVVN